MNRKVCEKNAKKSIPESAKAVMHPYHTTNFGPVKRIQQYFFFILEKQKKYNILFTFLIKKYGGTIRGR